ncbi:putative reverse transcriptase domain-containing protein [Tanacetum coccineum]
MPPRRLKKKSIKRLVEKRVAKAIEEYKKSRANLDRLFAQDFSKWKASLFKGIEGVVGLRRWIEKVEQVFETGKCAEEDKVMFAASTFEGRALTWWNGNRLVEKRVAKAIEEYEKSRANLDSAGSSGGNNGNAGKTMNVQGCLHKTFLNGKPHSFKGIEDVVGLRRWIEKVEQVFETGKCAEEDKVMFAASTFEGRALTWWNGNVHTLRLVNANHIPWTEFKTMITTEYCPAIEIQKIEQELWTLTLKGDDIEAYNNRFHERALMCPKLVPTKRKKIEKYVRGFPERIKGNITSSKPATLHDAINMARELVEQSV